ncbi:hypothetical protein [Actinoplanes sp. NPDC051851]|uniref:hypothetical protein n=1 Tax=Actinoplanes sp. NPDC051851 TaxID=3154753 RepID=UPI0034336D76
MRQSSPGEPRPELETSESAAADVSGRTLLELLHDPDSEVAASVQRLLAEREHRHDVVAGWNSLPPR